MSTQYVFIYSSKLFIKYLAIILQEKCWNLQDFGQRIQTLVMIIYLFVLKTSIGNSPLTNCQKNLMSTDLEPWMKIWPTSEESEWHITDIVSNISFIYLKTIFTS